jgi:hypothetical protein
LKTYKPVLYSVFDGWCPREKMGTGKILHCCPKESKKGTFGLYVRIIVGERLLPLLFICPNLLDQAIYLPHKARSVMNNAFGLGYLS